MGWDNRFFGIVLIVLIVAYWLPLSLSLCVCFLRRVFVPPSNSTVCRAVLFFNRRPLLFAAVPTRTRGGANVSGNFAQRL